MFKMIIKRTLPLYNGGMGQSWNGPAASECRIPKNYTLDHPKDVLKYICKFH